MNTLTKTIVSEVAKENKSAARRNDYDFRCLVEAAWWEHLLIELAQPRQARFYDLLALFHPECFEFTGGEAYLRSYEPHVYDLEVTISRRLLHWLRKQIAARPHLQLEDWGTFPQLLADPQLRMF